MRIMAVNEVMAALSDETRRQILEILRKGKTNTGDLARWLGWRRKLYPITLES